ncbi:MAG: nucleoside monophosphate kinase [Patescibacteria group bacterium]|nr:nucleoside monophosphate kinase [Patescibacteria group bacterium]
MRKKTFLIFFGPPGSGKGTQADVLAKKLKLPVICPGDLLRHEIELRTEIGRKVRPTLNAGELVTEIIVGSLVEQRLQRCDAEKGAIFDGYPRRQKQLNFLIKILLAAGVSHAALLPSKIAGNATSQYCHALPEARLRKSGAAGGMTSCSCLIYAILVDVSDKEVKQRLGGRRICDCGAVYHLKYNPPKKRGVCDLCGKKLYIRNDDKPAVIADRLRLYHRQTKPLLDYFQQRGKLIKINGEQSIKDVEKEIWGSVKQLNS